MTQLYYKKSRAERKRYILSSLDEIRQFVYENPSAYCAGVVREKKPSLMSAGTKKRLAGLSKVASQFINSQII